MLCRVAALALSTISGGMASYVNPTTKRASCLLKEIVMLSPGNFN